ncbi:hypothetical protein SAMN02745898_109115 [Streptomyces sp. 136MFCol5.1]|nr:hypothetical protein SAMN02745898_109115 [Streptomyces sp. 136MFCol5.1]
MVAFRGWLWDRRVVAVLIFAGPLPMTKTFVP